MPKKTKGELTSPVSSPSKKQPTGGKPSLAETVEDKYPGRRQKSAWNRGLDGLSRVLHRAGISTHHVSW
ncbi:MAG: hypothetical protein OEW12_08025, partial [Deltaproteobacteria bacterium]|nr:hypothetical protein [Deltaproteobacteria bacterium]